MHRSPQSIWHHIVAEHLADFRWPASLAVVVGYAGVFLSITKIVRDITGAWPGQQEFQLYLFLTYFPTVIGWAALLLLARTLWHRLQASYDQRGLAAQITHRMAEVIRARALQSVMGDGPKPLDDDTALKDVFADVLKLLDKKLGRTDITIAVKSVEGAPDNRVLRAATRHPRPELPSERKGSIPAMESVIYKQFIDGSRRVRRVIIRDVHALDVDPPVAEEAISRHTNYKQYAKVCGFRSVVAFPLRQPPGMGELEATGILGFLSLDCPDPNAFDKLFAVEARGRAASNDGRHFKDNGDIHLFFGLADSLATLAVLDAK